ncbi:MAG: cation:proton antiporter [Candidatus Brocadia sp.]|nr:cation:proton antiporter [Candidatus Brocadia sp.]
MHTFKPNLAFIIIFISFYCSVAIGSPPLGTEHSTPAKEQNPADIQVEAWPLIIEKIFSPRKYLKRYLEIAKKEALQGKSPDREYRSIVVEEEISSTDGEKMSVSTPGRPAIPVVGKQSLIGEEKGTRTSTVDNVPPQVITDEKAPSPPAIVKEKGIQEGLPADGAYHAIASEEKIPVDNQKMDAHLIPATPDSETISVEEQQSSFVEEDVTQAYVDNNKSLQSTTGKAPSATGTVEEKTYQEGSLTADGHQPITSFSEAIQETKEESTPMTVVTPEVHGEIIAVGEPEAKGTQTLAVENKLHSATDENGTLTSAEEFSYAATEGSPGILDKGAKEPERETSTFQSSAEVGKKEKESNFSWDIWHTNPALSIIMAVAITLIAATIGGWLASIMTLPKVVGNLIMGIILGNFFFLTGSEFFDFLRAMPFLKMISYFGTLLLLLTAGLHTDIRALLKVGASSFLVSLGGILAPAGLGLIVGYFLLSDAAFSSKLLLAIIICNTSTGLLFAILSELKIMDTLEGRIIIGATLLTEIIVILTFGIVSGIATKNEVSVMNILVTAGIAFSFLAVVLIIVIKYGERFGNFLTSKVAEGLKISIVIILSLMFAFISGSIGLHGVIGAFAAGLLLRNVKFKDSDDKEYSNVERIIQPYYMILVPILFVRVGAQVELESILNKDAVLLGLAITSAAVIGKLFCSICPIGKGINRMAIGIGMAMKLEGTLILSGIARDMGILNDVVFSSIIMVIVSTSVLCPSLLKASLVRHKRRLSKSFHVTVDKNTKEIFLRFKSKAQR